MQLTEAQLARNQQAPRKHGAYAFQSRGEASLTEGQLALYVELQDGLKTPEGVAEAKLRLAATALEMVELARTYLREKAEAGEPVFGDPIERRYSTWVAEARRQLEGLPEHPTRQSLNEVLNG